MPNLPVKKVDSNGPLTLSRSEADEMLGLERDEGGGTISIALPNESWTPPSSKRAEASPAGRSEASVCIMAMVAGGSDSSNECL